MKIWRFIVIPAAVFVVGFILFSRILNQGLEDLTMDMPEATLPVVYVVEDGERINALYGYTEEMDAASMRDTITPVEIGSDLEISIDSYGEEIRSVSYEVRSLDTTHLIQQSEAGSLSVDEDGEVVTAELPIESLLEEQTEYLLILEVESSGSPCYFYTRIIQDDDSDIDECISFVRDFHEITMTKTRQNELTDYMETTAGEDNSTLHFVTLRNSLSQVCWGDLRVTEVTEPMLSVSEISDSFNVIFLDYVISAANEEGTLEYYNVEEYYRVRKGEERIYLLDFERTVEEIFRGENTEAASDELVLGIRSSDVDYLLNDTGTIVCFVQEGELWSCNMESGRLTKIFGFRSLEWDDARENYEEHDIRILQISETGSVDFVVYGYMNRGDHEGQVGISICHFDSATTTVEELVFLPYESSYEMLSSEIGQAMYLTDSGLFYLIINDRIYSIDLSLKKYSVLTSDMTEGDYAYSDDGRYLAWSDGESGGTLLHLIDLETGRSSDIEAPDGYLIRPLGFMESDCVYGLARQQDVLADSFVFPMSRVLVVDFSGSDLSVLKTYEASDAYVTGATVANGNIYLERKEYRDGKYLDASEDVIYNRTMQDTSAVQVVEIYSEVRETEVALQLSREIAGEPELAESKLIRSADTVLSLPTGEGEKAYYVYAKGRVVLGTDRLAEAVVSADENAGVVIGTDQTYAWRAARHGSAQIDYPLSDGSLPEGQTWDLTGCTLSQVLYYVDLGLPVFAVRGGTEVVITGYDASSVTIYDPVSDTSDRESLKEAGASFESGGNQFSVTAVE